MDERERIWTRRFDVPVLIAALLVIPVITIEQTAHDRTWRHAAAALNWVIWVVFLAEFLVLLWTTGDRGRWLRTHPLEVAIVVLTPPFLPSSLQTARLFRLLRLLRLLRLVQVGKRLFTLDGLKWAAVLAGMTALGGGAAFAAAEGRQTSTWDGVWWAISTMTTVGYGDMYPHTNLGRVIAILVMIIGIGFGSLLVAALAERFVRGEVAEGTAEVETELHLAEADLLSELAAVQARLQRIEAALRGRPAETSP